MRIVLIGDIHWYRLRVAPWKLFGKRLLGQANLWLNRRKRFDPTRMGPVVQRAMSLKPDILLLSGDFTTTTLQGEFEGALNAIKPLVDQVQTTLAVPGNHDRYTFSSQRTKHVEQALGELMPTTMPCLTRLNDRWSVLAMDAAVPRCLSSRGRLGQEALLQAKKLLDSLDADQGVFVLCHYALGNPPDHAPMKQGHRLDEDQALIEILSQAKSKTVYMHGHVHEPWCWHRSERFIDLNAGSPTMQKTAYPHGQGFWEIQIYDQNLEIDLTHHVQRGPVESVQWTKKLSAISHQPSAKRGTEEGDLK